MSTNVDELVNTYKSVSEIPGLLDGYIKSNGIVSTFWVQRNLEKPKSSRFIREIFINNLEKVAETFPLDISTEIMSNTSKSEKFRAVLRFSDRKQFLEIWQGHNIIRIVDLNTLDVHGAVYANGEFSSFEWSPDEKKILYVAEKKKSKSEPFYKRKSFKENGNGFKEQLPRGEQYIYSQDWGDKMVGKCHSVIAQYNIETDTVEILKGIPEDVFVVQPKYSPDGSYIVGVAYQLKPRKLGFGYCNNRSSSIFYMDFEGKYVSLSTANVSIRDPIFSPGGEYLLWLQRKSGGPHGGAHELIRADMPPNENTVGKVIVEIIDKEQKIEGGKLFYGLFNTIISRRPWASQHRLVISSHQKYSLKSYVIDVESCSITELQLEDGSLRVLDIFEDTILAAHRHFFKPDKVIIGKLPLPGKESEIVWKDLTIGNVLPSFENRMFEYLDLQAPQGEVRDFNAIYVGPKSGKDKSVPLVVWPHGGPHGVLGNFLFLEEIIYLLRGFAILLINYRGSLGSGQKSVEFLPGKIGSLDVQDCNQAADAALSRYSWLNPDQLALAGCCHGGFLAAHLSGQYPDKYKVVVTRNPVIDLASLSIISDIPDWSYVQTGKEYTQKGEIDNDILIPMRKASPIAHAHKVKAPTLLHIGSRDLRVPPQQGIEYYHRLKANGVITKMHLYDDDHLLEIGPNKFDNIINSILWIEKHLGITT